MRALVLGLVLGLVLAAGAAGCSSSGSGARPAGPAATAPSSSVSTPGSSPPSSPPSSPTSQEPAPAPYQPYAGEVDVAAKRTAARAVEALPRVERVTYTQYFGYLPPAASILVEADFMGGGGNGYDVRISQRGGRWRVDSVEAAQRVAPLAAQGRLVRQVLESDRIELPYAGRVDVAAGRVSDSVLRSMLAVSQQHRIGVSVIVSPHPVMVFGTDRRSNHPDGLAYDIGTVDGRLVVARRNADLVHEVMRIAAGTGAYQVGGPSDLDGSGSQYFSDQTHSDHVHVGFSS